MTSDGITYTLKVDASQFVAMAEKYAATLCALARYGAEMIEKAGIEYEPGQKSGILDEDGNEPRELWGLVDQLLGTLPAKVAVAAKGSAAYDHRCGPGCACASSGGHAPCAGPNCRCTDGKSHSAECVAAHEAAYTGVKA